MGNAPKLLMFQETEGAPLNPLLVNEWLEAMHSLIKDPTAESVERFIHLCEINEAKLQKYPEVRANLDYRINAALENLQQTCEAPDRLIDYYFDVFEPRKPPAATAREAEDTPPLATDGTQLGIISRDGERTVKSRQELIEQQRAAREALRQNGEGQSGGNGSQFIR